MKAPYKKHISAGDLTKCDSSCLLFLLLNSSHNLLHESMEFERGLLQTFRNTRNGLAHATELLRTSAQLEKECSAVKVCSIIHNIIVMNVWQAFAEHCLPDLLPTVLETLQRCLA